MKKLISMVLVCIMVCSMFTGVFADEKISATFLYVATSGADTNSGSADAPFATLNKAVEASRSIDGPVVINIKGGEYALGDTIKLTSADKDLVIRATNGEEVIMAGGTRIAFSDFKAETDEELLKKIVTGNARAKVITADLKALGIENYGKIQQAGFGITNSEFAPTLTYNDRYLTMAQYPNGNDYLYVTSIIDDDAGDGTGKNFTYKVNDERYKKWETASDIWAIGWYVHDWAESITPATIDFKTGVISSYCGFRTPETDKRVKFFNLFEELDAPGEYYIDREAGKLYMIAPDGFKAGENIIFSAHNKDIITLDKAENVTIQGIRFEGTTTNGVVGSDCKNCVVDACEFTAIGNFPVGFFGDNRDCIIKNSYIHDVGSYGVRISGGVLETLERGNNAIENCHIERFMQYKLTYTPAVQIDGVGNRVSHCEINDGPHEGVGYTGAYNIFEYNNVYRVCTDTADSGAIYTGRNWTHRNNEIRHNYFHDLEMIDTTTGMEMQAIYLDDMHASTKVYGNVIYKCDSVALYGGGRHNTFENNLMLDCKKPFVFDARGANGGWEDMVQTMIDGAKKVPYKEGAWAEQVPEIANLLEDEPEVPKYNVIKNNLILNTPDMEIDGKVSQYGTVEAPVAVAKNDFVNYGKDFTLKEDSKIFTKLPEFKQIEFSKMGRYDYTVEDKWTAEASAPEAPADDTIKVMLNGEKIDFADVAPQIINDRTMVPLRAIFEALGAEVSWDDATKTVTAKKGDITIKMTIGKDSFMRNDESVSLDSPATIVDSRTLVPVRAIAESFGSTVGWDGETKTVTIAD